jgi:hypothetical protein
MRSLGIITLAVSIAALTSCSNQGNRSASDRTATERTSYTQSNTPRADIDLGRSIGTDRRASDKTDTFRPTDTIYATINARDFAPNAEIRARWMSVDGEVIEETNRTITQGQEVAEFHVAKPGGLAVGKYKLELFVNGQLAGSKDFEVKPAS